MNIHIPENPFRRKPTCGGCSHGYYADKFPDKTTLIPPKEDVRRYIIPEGSLVCAERYTINPNGARVRACQDCRFSPSRYSPIPESVPNMLMRWIGAGAQMVDAIVDKLVPYDHI